MAKRKGKTVTFDAMVKFFMQTYDIPTKRDVEKLLAKLDRIEKLLKSVDISGQPERAPGRRQTTYKLRRGSGAMTATEKVYQVVENHKQGIGVNELSLKTGFDVKKIRNVIFRLHKNNMIRRKSRGLYVVE